ncbi:MAG TPA: hypothetical protein VIU35_06105, partial [Chitinophagaceae bacterium]
VPGRVICLKKFVVTYGVPHHLFLKSKFLIAKSPYGRKFMHENPVLAGLCSHSLQYKYSSAYFYHTSFDKWEFLTHIRD